MSTIKEQYAELLTLTRQYLLQNYEAKATKATDLESFTYFKHSAKQQREQQERNPQTPPQKTAASHPPIVAKQELPTPSPALPKQQLNKETTPHPVIQPKKKEAAPLPFSNSTSFAENSKTSPPEKKTVTEASENSKAFFQLAPLTPATALDLSDIRQIVTERFPSQKIIDEIPRDTAVKRKISASNASPIEMLIFAFSQDPKQQAFLSNVANAINLMLKVNVQLVNSIQWEQEVDWNKEFNEGALQLVIANRELIQTLPKMREHYRVEHHESDNLSAAKYYLGKTPLCIIPEIESYFKDPKLKASLWKSICDTKSTN